MTNIRRVVLDRLFEKPCVTFELYHYDFNHQLFRFKQKKISKLRDLCCLSAKITFGFDYVN